MIASERMREAACGCRYDAVSEIVTHFCRRHGCQQGCGALVYNTHHCMNGHVQNRRDEQPREEYVI